MYHDGQRVPVDMVAAFQLFRKAAETGYPLARLQLGVMYVNGEGVATDYVWAWAWLDSVAREFEGAGQIRDRIAEEMSQAQIERAKFLESQKRLTMGR